MKKILQIRESIIMTYNSEEKLQMILQIFSHGEGGVGMIYYIEGG
jgi:hypothetical protein